MIERDLSPTLLKAASRFPVVTVTGPRQSGKSTLVAACFPDRPLVSLEDPDVRRFAAADPRGFLASVGERAVFDEVQRVPELASYLQGLVDKDPSPGRYVLTGSQNLSLMQSVSQSLAGRSAVARLLPCSFDEVQRFDDPPGDLFEALWAGGYPAIHDRRIPVQEWLSPYVSLYVERDVRQLLNVGDLTAFESFLRLAAGRAGQLVNLSALGADAGITHNTAKAWISVLDAAFLAFQLRPYHPYLSSRTVKAPKLYFHDTGLLCHLMGIREPEQLLVHPLRGAVFESWVVSEATKVLSHAGVPFDIGFFRDRSGLEVDLLVRCGSRMLAVEAKSGKTAVPEAGATLQNLARKGIPGSDVPSTRRMVVYGGEERWTSNDVEFIPWRQWGTVLKELADDESGKATGGARRRRNPSTHPDA